MIFASKMIFSKKSYAFKARYLKSNVSNQQAIYIFEKFRISAFTGKKINIFYHKLAILRRFEIWHKSDFLNEKVKILKNSECMRKWALWGPMFWKMFQFLILRNSVRKSRSRISKLSLKRSCAVQHRSGKRECIGHILSL